MSRIHASIGRNRDWPQLEVAAIASAAAGSAADTSTIVCHLPDLTLGDLPLNLNQKDQSELGSNASRLRQVTWVNNAANRAASGATNYYDFQLRLYRAGVLQGVLAYDTQSVSTTITPAVSATGVQTVAVASTSNLVAGMPLYCDSAGTPELIYLIAVDTVNTKITANFTQTHLASATLTSEHLQNWATAFVPARSVAGGTSATSITAGSHAVTPNANNGINGMYGIHVNDWLYFSGGTGAAETVQVSAVTATTFTATFANVHSGAYTFSTVGNPNTPGAANFAYNQGTGGNFEILGGDVLVLARVSNNVTGLASDAGILQLEWVPSRVGR